MKRSAILLACLPFSAAAPLSASTTEAPPATFSGLYRNVTQFDFASKISGRTYRVQVMRPTAPPPRKGYPVIYFTDAALNFNTAADQMWGRQLIDLRPAIIVGVGYPSPDLWDFVRLRNKDLIPWAPRGDTVNSFAQIGKFGGYGVEDTGGAEAFYRFLTEELRPRVAGIAPTDVKAQALYGHSLGGLFALYTLFEHPNAFSTYIVSSPSLWYNQEQVLEGIPKLKRSVEAGESSPRILLEAGGLEALTYDVLRRLPPDRQVKAIAAGSEVDGVLALAKQLEAIKGAPDYRVESHIFEGENHLSVVPASVTRALTFSFGVSPPP